MKLVATLAVVSLATTVSACKSRSFGEELTAFYDEADRAFLEGDGERICDLRTSDFVLESEADTFLNADIVDSLEGPMALEWQHWIRSQSPLREETIGRAQYCSNIRHTAARYKDTLRMRRVSLKIVSMTRRSVVAEATYVGWMPICSPLSAGCEKLDGIEKFQTIERSRIVSVWGQLKFRRTHERSLSSRYMLRKPPGP